MSKSYIDQVLFNTPHECLRNFSRHNSLIENLNRVFSGLCESFEFIFTYDNCLHMFVNPNFQEIDILSTTQIVSRIIYDDNLPYKVYSYERVNLETSFAQFQHLTRAFKRDNNDYPTPEKLDLEDMNKLLKLLNVNAKSESEAIIIPFDHRDLNLGIFILWGDKHHKHKKNYNNEVKYLGWLASLYSFLRNHFIRELEILDIKGTYLPSLYASRWKKTAILFAEIKNFLPLEERLRQIYAPDENTQQVREIINRHCREMSKIVTQFKGRVERFFGTGLMALFGEHDNEYSKAAASAICAATQMMNTFREMKSDLLKQAISDDYEIEYNQHVNVNLAIGIDFGTILFEYLGDDHHQKFTAIGDHVNMAELLMNQASGNTTQGNQNRPILFSPTVERLTSPWIEPGDKRFEHIYDLSTGLSFPAYGIFPDAFDQELFDKCVDGRNNTHWDDVWKGRTRPY